SGGLRGARALYDDPSLAPRSRDERSVQARRLFYLLDVFQKRREDLLENVRRRVLAEARGARDGVDEPLVASQQSLPGRRVAPPAGSQQILVALTHRFGGHVLRASTGAAHAFVENGAHTRHARLRRPPRRRATIARAYEETTEETCRPTPRRPTSRRTNSRPVTRRRPENSVSLSTAAAFCSS